VWRARDLGLRVSLVVAAVLWVVACIDRQPGQQWGSNQVMSSFGCFAFWVCWGFLGVVGVCSGNLCLLLAAKDVRLARPAEVSARWCLKGYLQAIRRLYSCAHAYPTYTQVLGKSECGEPSVEVCSGGELISAAAYRCAEVPVGCRPGTCGLPYESYAIVVLLPSKARCWRWCCCLCRVEVDQARGV
jgi:hypothetical protein